MSLGGASSYNMSIGTLRNRSNNDDQFNKAISDRLNMLKFDAPDAGEAKTAQTEVKGAETTGALKAISDAQGTYKAGKTAMGKIADAGKAISSKVGELSDAVQGIGAKSAQVQQQGIRALSTEALQNKAVIKAKTTIKSAQPSSAQSPNQPVSADKPTETSLPDLDDLKANLTSAPTKPQLPSLEDDLKPMAGGAEGDALDEMEHQFSKPVSALANQASSDAGRLTQLADFRQPGASVLAQVAGGGRSRAVAGATQNLAGRANPMNVANSLTGAGDNSANAQLAGLKNALTNTSRAGENATGSLAKASTNIHADVSGALEEMKGQMGDALSNIQSHLSNVSSQVASVGKGVEGVGEDVANVATKAIGGVSAGLETAGVVADALGPIGDLVGLGMAIFGGIKAHEAHERAEKANEQAQQQVSQAPQTASMASTTASLDTAKQAQAGAVSHY